MKKSLFAWLLCLALLLSCAALPALAAEEAEEPAAQEEEHVLDPEEMSELWLEAQKSPDRPLTPDEMPLVQSDLPTPEDMAVLKGPPVVYDSPEEAFYGTHPGATEQDWIDSCNRMVEQFRAEGIYGEVEAEPEPETDSEDAALTNEEATEEEEHILDPEEMLELWLEAQKSPDRPLTPDEMPLVQSDLPTPEDMAVLKGPPVVYDSPEEAFYGTHPGATEQDWIDSCNRMVEQFRADGIYGEAEAEPVIEEAAEESAPEPETVYAEPAAVYAAAPAPVAEEPAVAEIVGLDFTAGKSIADQEWCMSLALWNARQAGFLEWTALTATEL